MEKKQDNTLEFLASRTGKSLEAFQKATKREINSTRDLAGQNLVARGAFYPHLLKNGVFIPDVHLGFLSAAHSEKDVGAVIQAHKNALMELRDLELL